MKNVLFVFLLFPIFSFAPISEKTIGDLNGYNLKVKVVSNENKRSNAFHSVVNQTIVFRLKEKTLTTKLFAVKDYDGYVMSGITTLKYNNQLFYELEFYRSNGSPEIYEIYNVNGLHLAKGVASKGKSTYTYFSKNINSTFFTKSKTIKNYDLTDLWN